MGLMAGLLIGGLGLFAVGARPLLFPKGCGPSAILECHLQQQIESEAARRQAPTGVALMLFGIALFLGLRKRL